MSFRPTFSYVLALLFGGAVVAAGSAASYVAVLTKGAAPPARIMFPIAAKAHYTDTFGAARAQGGHEGTDVMSDWRAPAVAAEAGTVKIWTRSARAGCMLYLYGESGTTYLYVHLNNDRTSRNDNRGGCKNGVAFAPGLKDGQKVDAGELIAFVGDSGDANGIHPHVHFELHPRDGAAVSPYRWLRRAHQPLFALPSAAQLDSREILLAQLDGTVVGREASPAGPSLVVRVRAAVVAGIRSSADRDVRLALAPDVVVERAGTPAASLALATVKRGDRVRVDTSPLSGTRAEQQALPRALEAARITLLPSP